MEMGDFDEVRVDFKQVYLIFCYDVSFLNQFL